jgi:hypothetical protein
MRKVFCLLVALSALSVFGHADTIPEYAFMAFTGPDSLPSKMDEVFSFDLPIPAIPSFYACDTDPFPYCTLTYTGVLVSETQFGETVGDFRTQITIGGVDNFLQIGGGALPLISVFDVEFHPFTGPPDNPVFIDGGYHSPTGSLNSYSITTITPEPSTIGLLGTGVLGLLGAFRRRMLKN